MDAESFFSRWSKHRAESAAETPDDTAEPIGAAQPEQTLPPPSIEEVAALTPQSDYTRFVARGVDENIRRSAFKKLFADPHFNVMDGLDTYIADYNKFEPIPPEMLALLNHAKGLLDPRAQFEHPLMRLAENLQEPDQATAGDPVAVEESTAERLSATEETDALPPLVESDAKPIEPGDSTPLQTTTRHDDDHTI